MIDDKFAPPDDPYQLPLELLIDERAETCKTDLEKAANLAQGARTRLTLDPRTKALGELLFPVITILFWVDRIEKGIRAREHQS